MRAGELLGARVVTSDGRPVGFVTGLRCSLDGPSDGPVPAPRLRALVVTPRRLAASLGYQQGTQHGPWLVHLVVRLLHRNARLVDCGVVDRIGDGEIHLSSAYFPG